MSLSAALAGAGEIEVIADRRGDLASSVAAPAKFVAYIELIGGTNL